MLYVIPDYYPEFHCIAGACEDTCCAGWQIVIDEQSLARYRACRGPARRRLFLSIRWREKSFRQNREKRCAFLNKSNLCDLYQMLGERGLCKTCRRYPRHVEEFEGVREISLSASCPEAARILLERQEAVRFLEFEQDKEELGDYTEFDDLLYSLLVDTRQILLKLLQDRTLPLKLRCTMAAGLAADIQKRLQKEELFSCYDLLERKFGLSDQERTRQKRKEHAGEEFAWIRERFWELGEMEHLNDNWSSWLAEAEERLYQRGSAYYQLREQEFERWLAEDTETDWEILFEQLMVYYVFTYFCGAVYDGQVLASMQLAVTHVWILRDMLMACWLRNDQMIKREDMIELTCRYSREMEHSDQNQSAMEKRMEQIRLPWLGQKKFHPGTGKRRRTGYGENGFRLERVPGSGQKGGRRRNCSAEE